jgi:hypothetical protein
MARLTMAQTYAYARQAGFAPAQAVVMTAIAMGESGLVTDRRGDLTLQNATWGPSVGLAQVRSLKADTGRGTDRDISQLSDPLQNMIAAYHISNSGKDFTPWTVYNKGIYKQWLNQASAAAGGAAGEVTNTGVLVQAGLTDGLLGGVTDRLRPLGLQLLAIAAGATLVILGTWQAVGAPRPKLGGLAAVAL